MNNASVVLGTLWGDEGKGMMVDFIANKIIQHGHMPVVVRFSGAHQCGHTVRLPDVEHTFATFGSGTLRGAPTIYAGACLDPVSLIKEYEILESKGYRPEIFIDKDVGLTIPSDVIQNRTNTHQLKHGSCGRGVLQTILRTEGACPIYAMEVRNMDVLRHKLRVSEAFRYGDSKILEKEYMDACEQMSLIATFGDAVEEAKMNSEVIFEGNQGILLDHQYGFYPHVTPTCTMSRALERFATNRYTFDVYYMVRAYGTRHGNGPFSGEDVKINLKPDINESNEFNQWQGEFRKGALNLDLIESAIYMDRQTSNIARKREILTVTCFDHLDGPAKFIQNDHLLINNDMMLWQLASRNRMDVCKVGHPHWSSDLDALKNFVTYK